MTLDDILSNETPQKVEIVNPEPAKPEPKRDDSGKFAKGEEQVKPEPKPKEPEPEKAEEPKESAPPAPKKESPEPDHERGLKAAITAERTKRQALERELEQIRQQIAQQPKPQAPDVLQDPQGFQQHLGTQVQELESTFQQRLVNERLNMSEMLARQAHSDMDDVLAVFQEEAANNPALGAQALQQQHPWEWVYQQGKKLALMREIGSDPDAWRNAERERIRAEFAQQQERAVVTPPPSLASATSAPVREQQWSGPTSLNSILRKR